MSLPLAAALMLAALATSCTTGGVTNGGSDAIPPPPNQPTTPTSPTQSPVQVEMLSIAKVLGLSSSTKDIESFSYCDSSVLTNNILNINTNISSDKELIIFVIELQNLLIMDL